MGKEDLARHRDERYVPYPTPDEYDRAYLENELRRLQVVIENLTRANLDEIHQIPDKPRQGDLRFADGTDWDPTGQGQGVYIFINGSYRKFTTIGPVNIVATETTFTLTGNVPVISATP